MRAEITDAGHINLIPEGAAERFLLRDHIKRERVPWLTPTYESGDKQLQIYSILLELRDP